MFNQSLFSDIWYYFSLMVQIIKKCQESKTILFNMAKGLISLICKHTFLKNKIFLDYQRVLGICLFAISDGNFEALTVSELQ